MSTEQDPFANPKYSREELRAMARKYLSKKMEGDFRTLDVQLRLFMRTGMSPQEQLAAIREMAK